MQRELAETTRAIGNGWQSEPALSTLKPMPTRKAVVQGGRAIIEDVDFDNGGSPFNFNNANAGYNKPRIGVYQRLGVRNDEQPVGAY